MRHVTGRRYTFGPITPRLLPQVTNSMRPDLGPDLSAWTTTMDVPMADKYERWPFPPQIPEDPLLARIEDGAVRGIGCRERSRPLHAPVGAGLALELEGARCRGRTAATLHNRRVR